MSGYFLTGSMSIPRRGGTLARPVLHCYSWALIPSMASSATGLWLLRTFSFLSSSPSPSHPPWVKYLQLPSRNATTKEKTHSWPRPPWHLPSWRRDFVGGRVGVEAVSVWRIQINAQLVCAISAGQLRDSNECNCTVANLFLWVWPLHFTIRQCTLKFPKHIPLNRQVLYLNVNCGCNMYTSP